MNTYAPMHVANIVANGAVLFKVFFNVASYSVPAISYTDGRGKRQSVYGCKDAREAVIIAKRLAKLANKRKPCFADPASWRLEYVD